MRLNSSEDSADSTDFVQLSSSSYNSLQVTAYDEKRIVFSPLKSDYWWIDRGVRDGRKAIEISVRLLQFGLREAGEQHKQGLKEAAGKFGEKHKQGMEAFGEKSKQGMKNAAETFGEKHKEGIKEAAGKFGEKSKEGMKKAAETFGEKNKEGMKKAAETFGEKHKEGMNKAAGKVGGKFAGGLISGASVLGFSFFLGISLIVHDTIFTIDVLCVLVLVMCNLFVPNHLLT